MTLVFIDTSAWARIGQKGVAQRIADAIDADLVVIAAPIVLELLRSARDAAELVDLAEAYDALHQVAISDEIVEQAREVQATLARRGHHRGPSPVDLLAAAAAEAVEAEIWHCDKHFEIIASITDQLQLRLGK